MKIYLRLGSCLFLTLASVHCGGSKSGAPGNQMPAMAVVGTSGGAVASSDGQLQVAVPAGALPGNVTITVAPAETPASGAVGTVYEIGPTGTQFAMPVTLTLHYASASLGGMPESSLRVATFASGSWQLLPGAIVDMQAKTVSGVTTHLSPYAIVAQANGKTCATVRMDQTCTNAASAGGGSAGTCTASTCAGATNVCGAYPGASLDGCSDDATGFTATCCFPTDGPICFATGSTTTCAGNTGTGAAGGGSSCPPSPTCADAATTACAAYPGATLQNCVDGAAGYTGSCCFAPQMPVCVSTGSARGCSGNTGGGTTCPPAPRCADADPCGSYAGATAQSCTDGTNGFQATCCFALGTLPQAAAAGSGATNIGGRDAGTGTGGIDAGGTPDGGPGNGSCVQGAACQPGSPNCINASPTSCIECACSKDGVLLSCGPCSNLPDGGTTGGPDSGGPKPDSGTTGGPDSGASPCVAGGACQNGEACGGTDATGCTQCMCSAGGFFACSPCGGPKPDGGTTGGPDSGASACVAGGSCQPGEGCGGTDATGCTQCMCSAGGFFACSPCGGPKPDGGTTGGPDSGASACVAGGSCQPGEGCGGTDATGCTQCMCNAGGFFACSPCGGGKPDGGAPPPTDAGGGGGTTCQINSMPGGAGAPCVAMEMCPDGSNYRVQCDGTTSQCMCWSKGVPTGETPSVSCTGFDPKAALIACGFPVSP